MHVRRFATHIEVLAPGKVNLFLEVLAKRPDGFHELETVIVAITAYDSLVFEPVAADSISLECRWGLGLQATAEVPSRPAHELLYGEIPRGPENLVWRAVELVRQEARLSVGARIRLIKRVPAAAGLGGASSDAAATLVAANEAWQLHWSRERLIELAAKLGSDIPFFLTRGAAVCRGRGEQIASVRASRLHVTVVRPPVGLSTPQVYKRCQPTRQVVGATRLTSALAQGNAAVVGKHLMNDLGTPAASITPWIDTLRREFGSQNLVGHQMSGSGSSYFGLCNSARHARRVTARLRARRIGAVISATTAASNEQRQEFDT